MLFYLDNWMSADPNGPASDPRSRRQRPRCSRSSVTSSADRRCGPRFAGARTETPRSGDRPTATKTTAWLLGRSTLRVDGDYTQKDVTEVARAFTGWTIQIRVSAAVTASRRTCDDGEKRVGHVIPAGGGERDGEDVLDIVANHPSTARFISTKLARRFVSDTPPSALVDRMAATFTKTHGDLREVIRTLLTSREFLSKRHRTRKGEKTPSSSSSVAACDGADVNNALPTVRAIGQLGMPLYQCQPPTGYKDLGRHLGQHRRTRESHERRVDPSQAVACPA